MSERNNLAFIDFNKINRGYDDGGLAGLKARVDIVEVIGRYLPLKRQSGDLWACCPFHDEKRASFKADAKRQRFKCFGCGAGGDVVDFLAAIEGLSTPDAIRRLREMVGDTGFSPAPMRSVVPTPANNEPDNDEERRREAAQEIWRETLSLPRSGLPYDYLTVRRGLTKWDGDRLRWHPECPWAGAPGGTVGAIVVPVNDHHSCNVVGIWRIVPTMEGEVRRRGLGPQKFNAARLFWAPGPDLVIAEGVEDALAAHELTGLPAWAALSAGNMAALVLPKHLQEVTILADADDVGRAAAHTLAGRLREEGREAKVQRPTAGKDANDVLRARRAE